jgi:hypothetical protein
MNRGFDFHHPRLTVVFAEQFVQHGRGNSEPWHDSCGWMSTALNESPNDALCGRSVTDYSHPQKQPSRDLYPKLGHLPVSYEMREHIYVCDCPATKMVEEVEKGYDERLLTREFHLGKPWEQYLVIGRDGTLKKAVGYKVPLIIGRLYAIFDMSDPDCPFYIGMTFAKSKTGGSGI